MPALVWEGIGAQVTHLNQLPMAAFTLILLVTYMRPSELLALRKKDLDRWCHISLVIRL